MPCRASISTRNPISFRLSVASLLFLALLDAVGACAGGANIGRAALRVTYRGALAMALTAGIGALFGVVA